GADSPTVSCSAPPGGTFTPTSMTHPTWASAAGVQTPPDSDRIGPRPKLATVEAPWVNTEIVTSLALPPLRSTHRPVTVSTAFGEDCPTPGATAVVVAVHAAVLCLATLTVAPGQPSPYAALFRSGADSPTVSCSAPPGGTFTPTSMTHPTWAS